MQVRTTGTSGSLDHGSTSSFLSFRFFRFISFRFVSFRFFLSFLSFGLFLGWRGDVRHLLTTEENHERVLEHQQHCGVVCGQAKRL